MTTNNGPMKKDELKTDPAGTMTSGTFATGAKNVVQDKTLVNAGNVSTVSGKNAKIVDIDTLSEEEAYFRSDITARPVMLPDILDFVAKRNEYSYRWVQFKALDGKRYADMKYLGFEDATASDITMRNTQAQTSDGIIVGDLKLMKIQKELYFGMLKGNVERALAVTKRSGIASAARSQISTHGLNDGPRPQDRIGLFVPPQEVIDAKVEGREIAI